MRILYCGSGLVAGLVALFSACGSRDDAAVPPQPLQSIDTAVPALASPDSTEVAATAPAGGGCPEFAPWRECSVQYRLERAGLSVRRREKPVHHDWLSVDGVVWETTRSETQVFLYPSEEDRIRDTGKLDTVAVSPKGQRIIWKEPAVMVTSGNLLAIIITLNGRTSERIALALGAGLPRDPGKGEAGRGKGS